MPSVVQQYCHLGLTKKFDLLPQEKAEKVMPQITDKQSINQTIKFLNDNNAFYECLVSGATIH